LFKAGPAGINFEINTDEYDPQVATIIVRLSSAQSAQGPDHRRAKRELRCRCGEDLDALFRHADRC
jgi:hypothetical protein